MWGGIGGVAVGEPGGVVAARPGAGRGSRSKRGRVQSSVGPGAVDTPDGRSVSTAVAIGCADTEFGTGGCDDS